MKPDKNTNNRLNELYNLLEKEAMDQTGITYKTISRQVSKKLNTFEHEKIAYLRFKRVKIALIAAVILILSSATVFAMTHIDVLRDMFFGDTSKIQEDIYAPGESISNGEFSVMLEQAVSDKYCTLVIYSVEALSDKAKIALNDESFSSSYSAIIDFVVDGQEQFMPQGGGSLPELDEPNKKYFWVQVYGMDEIPDDCRLRTNILGLDYIDTYIPICRTSSIECYDIEINTEINSLFNYTIYNVGISRISLAVKVNQTDSPEIRDEDHEIFFRMKDGQIKTKNQFVDWGSKSGNGYDDYIVYYYRFKNVIDLDEFASIIVGGTEFSLRNGSQIPAFIEDNLESFEFNPVINSSSYSFNMLKYLNTLGTDYDFNEETGKLLIDYRGKELELTVANDTCIVNDTIKPLPEKFSLLASETLLIEINKLLDINQMWHFKDEYISETSEFNPEAVTWFFTP